MLIEGALIGNPDRCYIPIFRHFWENFYPPKAAKSILLGAHFMSGNTIVFDNHLINLNG